MSESLNKFKEKLSELVLNFVLEQWAAVGVMATRSPEQARVIDPEPLLLLTLEVARHDPRMFDEVLDWLITNGRWINVARLSVLSDADRICAPEVLGAVAATLSDHDKTPKWRNLAGRLKPLHDKTPEALFRKNGQPLFLAGSEPDAIFKSYGLLRTPVVTRGLSSPVLSSPASDWNTANFMFKARALFGVSIRADVFSFIVLHGASNPTRIARELGYSQRRVQDALLDMTSAGAFQVRNVGNTKEYFADSERVLRFLGALGDGICWFDWRTQVRALSIVWRRIFAMREENLTTYILESEQEKILREVGNDLLRAIPKRPVATRGGADPLPGEPGGLIEAIQRTLPAPGDFNWQRLWVARGGRISLADGGFPYVATFPWDKSRPEVVPYEAIASIPCLILLGEPGMGKSHAIRAAEKAAKALMDVRNVKLLFLDLKSYGSEERLKSELFGSPEFRGWSNGEYQLQVFLDSLDEALLNQQTIAGLLADEFGKLPSVKGLSLRVACRTADWPSELEQVLKLKWPEPDIGVYELAPVTRNDVSEAAKGTGVDANAFQRLIDEHDLVPLACKPITLKFLLLTFPRGTLDGFSQKQLYAKGCRILCEEQSPARRRSKGVYTLTPDQRFQIATRIAAATILCQRDAIWTGAESGNALESDVAMNELCGGPFSATGVALTRENVMETLSTGLFCSRGEYRLGWAHQTYAEFLAAQYLHDSKMSLEKMLKLLVYHGDSEGKLIPQLHETAAWLATMDDSIRAAILKTEPGILLGSDVASADDEAKEGLVGVLFKQLNSGDIDSLPSRGRLPKLKHPRMADQLRPCILARSKPRNVRLEAINLAEACEVTELAIDLAGVALDRSEDRPVREGAAFYVAHLGSATEKGRLKPLAYLAAEEDPDKELKGCALEACWPERLSAAELFSVLTLPSENGVYGTYSRFLTHRLIENIKPEDLPIALKWVRQQKPRRSLRHSFGELLDEILKIAAKNLGQTGLLGEFSKTILAQMRKLDLETGPDGWLQTIGNDDQLRLRVVESILNELSQTREGVEEAPRLMWGCPLLTPRDFDWLAGRLGQEAKYERQAVLAQWLRRAWNRMDWSQTEKILGLVAKIPAAQEQFSNDLSPIALNSERAKVLREMHESELGLQRFKVEAETPLDPPPSKRVLAVLDQFEGGKTDVFWLLVRELSLKATSRFYENEGATDVTELPGWNEAETSVRDRIVKAAECYVREKDANPDAWFNEPNIVHLPAAAGFKALYLLNKKSPAAFSALPVSVWSKWIPIILDYPVFHELEPHTILARKAYEAVPEDTLFWLKKTLDKEKQDPSALNVLAKLGDLWDSRIAGVFLQTATSPEISLNALNQLLKALLKHGEARAVPLATSLLDLRMSADESTREKALSAAQVLLEHSPGSWSVLWPLIVADSRFGRVTIAKLAYSCFHSATPFLNRLSEGQIKDLSCWLLEQYPPEKDQRHPGAHTIGSEEMIAHLRYASIQHLRDRGTSASCSALEGIQGKFPQLGLSQVLSDAKATTRKKNWRPPTPSELFALADQKDARLVRDGDELLEAVMESLSKLGTKLQGETPLRQFLWNEVAKNSFQPKDEAAFADLVKTHLQADLVSRGIIPKREVEIRRGQETDIHVDAVAKEDGRPYETVSVIIETKCSWNAGLEKDMESQLVGRYLRDNQSRHGIYLVGWFTSDKWDDKDYRRRRLSSSDKSALQERVGAKAAELSKAGIKVRAMILDAGLG
jgi:predicted NACHT family NTPase